MDLLQVACAAYFISVTLDFKKFARCAAGTNNIDHCARLCHASTVTGLLKTFGSGAMTNSQNEFEDAEAILLTGSNPTEQHPIDRKSVV